MVFSEETYGKMEKVYDLDCAIPRARLAVC